MIEPIRAPVRPRVRLQSSGEVVLLEDVVAEFLASEKTQTILLCGEVGFGTTTALQHLAERFASEPGVRLDGSTYFPEIPTEDPRAWILIHSETPRFGGLLRVYLVGWGRDEWIEYLLAVHRDRCASVMRRLQADSDCSVLEGNPSLWRHILDELAADEELKSVRAAIVRFILKMFPDSEVRRDVGWRSFLGIAPADQSNEQTCEDAGADVAPRFRDPLHPSMGSLVLLMAAEAVVREMADGDLRGALQRRWPQRLVEEVARHVAESTLIQDKLRALIEPKSRVVHPLAASLLHAAGTGWRPEPSRMFGLRTGWLNLTNAVLQNADWPGIHLPRCNLTAAVFSDANLAKANLHGAIARRTNFDRAKLDCAVLSRLQGFSASFVGANLTLTYGRRVELRQANLSSADLTEAELIHSDLESANLSEAIFRRACLTKTKFHEAIIDGADFTEADLDGANLWGLDLTVACFAQASFVSAYMRACNLEGMELPNANFAEADLSNALLTGSIMANACFYGANLQEAGMAVIEWEFADLRYANLRGVSFHMGSTRDGLVGSTIPMHGSRTGFYTDDYNEQDFKAPEEIRKANLRGADLRGADITDVDFYLVDLRDALYDREQEVHLRRCGAILETRTRDD